MVKFCALATGSEGNAFFLRTDSTAILIDAGLTCKQIDTRLKANGERAMDTQAVLITHSHGDHASGLKTMISKYHMPVYMTEGTRSAVDGSLADVAPEY